MGLSVDESPQAFYHEVMNPQRVSLVEAKNQLSDLITIASEGGEVIIVQDGKPVVHLVSATDATPYKSVLPTPSEFSTDDDSLAWEADGWENLA